jgi:asparagine synthase (glutamine-hydrolysing)
MCGIVGWVDWEKDLSGPEVARIMTAMAETLNHRGPDMQGQWQTTHAIFAHRRLAIIDPQSPPQPLVYREGAQTYALTFGGEIYNFRELRRELEVRGHRFQTHCDTEVLLHAYIEWGENCVQRLNGMFAFGLWDDAKRQLLLARDHLGVKPLFYAQRGSSLLFGSEIKALLAHPLVKPEVDREGLADIFSFRTCRVPYRTVYRDIYEVRSGHMAIFTQEMCRRVQYWSLRSYPHTDDLETTSERVRFLLEQAVTSQLVSDVPVVSMLSGGVDSSAVTMLASGAFRAEGKALDSYTVDYVESAQHFREDVLRSSLDTPWAERVSEHAQTRQHMHVISTPDLLENFFVPLHAHDMPSGGQIETSLYLLCKALKHSAPVALSGEASDEIFGSYAWFQQEEALNAETFPWLAVLTSTGDRSQNLLVDWLSPDARAAIPVMEYVSHYYQQGLAEVPVLPGENAGEKRMREVFYLGMTQFLQHLLDRQDRMSMAASVEVRVPFCDHRFVEYIWNIPWKMKMVDGIEKGILRRAVAGLIPEDVRLRRKSAYPISYSPSYLEALQAWVRNILADPAAPIVPLINRTLVNRLIMDQQPSLSIIYLYEYLIQVNTWLRDYHVEIHWE